MATLTTTAPLTFGVLGLEGACNWDFGEACALEGPADSAPALDDDMASCVAGHRGRNVSLASSRSPPRPALGLPQLSRAEPTTHRCSRGRCHERNHLDRGVVGVEGAHGPLACML